MAGDLQPGDLPGTNLRVKGPVKERVVEVEFAGAVDMDVVELKISACSVEAHAAAERRLDGPETVEIEIGEGKIAAIGNGHRQAIRALRPLLFHLAGINLPIGYVSEDHFVANMMLAGERVNPSLGCGVGNADARLRVRAGGPNICERPATAVGHPETVTLRIPSAVGIGIAGTVAVVRLDARSVGGARAVAAQKPNVVHERILPRHPFKRHRPSVIGAGIQPDAGDDV